MNNNTTDNIRLARTGADVLQSKNWLLLYVVLADS